MKISIYLIAVSLLLSNLALAEEFEVGQKNKAFSKKELRIKKGDTIHFTNQDPFFHNVYSMSDPASFDLGSYAKGQSKSVQFKKKGDVIVQCAIHPFMKIKIKVE